jgi:hypothetical protein
MLQKAMVNPCSEISLNGRATAERVFTICINYMHNEGVSLYETIHKVGYTIEDLRKLILDLYNVEDFYGQFIADTDNTLGLATRVFNHLLASFDNKDIVPGRKNDDLVIDYGREKEGEKELIEVMEMPLSQVPLFLNKSNLQKAIAKWRLSINK